MNMNKINCKAQTKLFCFLLFFFAYAFPVMADSMEEVVKKEIHTFKVQKGATVNIENQFGDITVSHTSGNEVTVRIEISSKARSANAAQESLDRINIEINQKDNLIKGKTNIRSSNLNSTSLAIHYYVNVPSWMNLDLKQTFGNITLPESDNEGICKLYTEYGNISAGTFSQPLKVNAKFGTITIDKVESSDINISYCNNSSINEAQDLNVTTSFSDLTIKQVKQLKINSSYDKLKIGNITDLSGKTSFSNMSIKYLINSFSLSQQSYSDVTIEKADAKFKKISSNASFCKLNIALSKQTKCTVNAYNLTFSKCKIDSSFKLSKDEQDKDSRSCEINGGNDRIIDFDGGGYASLHINAID